MPLLLILHQLISLQNWNGNVVDGVQRAPIALICDDLTPCTGIALSNVNMWSQTGKAVYKCESAFGSGVGCIKSGTASSYAVVTVTPTQPAGYSTPTTMSGDLASGYPSTATIPVPSAIPTSFYPGLAAYSKLMSAQTTGGAATTTSKTTTTSTVKATSTSTTSTTKATATSSGTVAQYGQCGGSGYTGATSCVSPYGQFCSLPSLDCNSDTFILQYAHTRMTITLNACRVLGFVCLFMFYTQLGNIIPF